MSDTSSAWNIAWIIGFLSLYAWIIILILVIPYSDKYIGEIFFVSIIAAIITGVIAGYIEHSRSSGPSISDTDALDVYTPVRTSKQLYTVTPIHNIEEIGKYAECPYCGSNIRETFYELGGIVRCDKCGAFHHKECFEYYGNKCGSSSCKLRGT